MIAAQNAVSVPAAISRGSRGTPPAKSSRLTVPMLGTVGTVGISQVSTPAASIPKIRPQDQASGFRIYREETATQPWAFLFPWHDEGLWSRGFAPHVLRPTEPEFRGALFYIVRPGREDADAAALDAELAAQPYPVGYAHTDPITGDPVTRFDLAGEAFVEIVAYAGKFAPFNSETAPEGAEAL